MSHFGKGDGAMLLEIGLRIFQRRHVHAELRHGGAVERYVVEEARAALQDSGGDEELPECFRNAAGSASW